MKEIRSPQTGNSWDPHIGPEAWKEGNHSKHHTHFTNAESRLKMPHDETKQPQWVSAGAEPHAQALWVQSPFLAIKPHQALGLGGSRNCPQVCTIQVETKTGLIHRKNYLPKIYSLSMPCSYKNWRWPLSLSEQEDSIGGGLGEARNSVDCIGTLKTEQGDHSLASSTLHSQGLHCSAQSQNRV